MTAGTLAGDSVIAVEATKTTSKNKGISLTVQVSTTARNRPCFLGTAATTPP